MSTQPDRASDTGQRRSVGFPLIDNKTAVSFSVVLVIIALSFWVGKEAQKSTSEKGAIESQIEATRAENKAHCESLKKDIESLSANITLRGNQLDKEIDEVHKHLEKLDEQISQLTKEMIQLKTKQGS